MKNKRVKRFFQSIFLNDYSWKLIAPFVSFAERVKASRLNYKQLPEMERLFAKAELIFADKIVKNGPFKGMNFGNARPDADSIYAKLLGSYETEIHHYLNDIFKNNYKYIVNIGSEDGYYAVGLALKFPDAEILAFDIDPVAQKNTMTLARLNNVSSRISVSGKCTEKDIYEFNLDHRILMIVDCEGDESVIFTSDNARLLSNADLIIEMHLQKYPLLEEYFRNLFEHSHQIAVVGITPDHIKAMTYNLPELAGMDYQLKRFITGERDNYMQWMYLKSKAH